MPLKQSGVVFNTAAIEQMTVDFSQTVTCSLADVFPSADFGLLGGLSICRSGRRECFAIAFGPVTSLGMAFTPGRRWRERGGRDRERMQSIKN